MKERKNTVFVTVAEVTGKELTQAAKWEIMLKSLVESPVLEYHSDRHRHSLIVLHHEDLPEGQTQQ
jgi:hypothetical protein